MNKIDWFYLKNPIIMFAVAIVISVALGFVGYQFEKAKFDEYQNAVSTLRTTHQLYRNSNADCPLRR